MLKRTIYSLAIVALIAGCSSGTKLSDTPVVDRSGAAGGAGGAASGVAPVSIDPRCATAQQGPVGVARIIYFDFDSYTIKPEFQSLVDGHARFLKANPQRRIVDRRPHRRARRPRVQPCPGPEALRSRAPFARPPGCAGQPDRSRELRQGKAGSPGQQ